MPNIADPKRAKELNDEDLKQVSGGGIIHDGVEYEFEAGTWFKQQINRLGTIKTYIYYIEDYHGISGNNPVYKCSVWFEKVLGTFAGPNTDYIWESTLKQYTKLESRPGGI